jgi:hypothetical protein
VGPSTNPPYAIVCEIVQRALELGAVKMVGAWISAGWCSMRSIEARRSGVVASRRAAEPVRQSRRL